MLVVDVDAEVMAQCERNAEHDHEDRTEPGEHAEHEEVTMIEVTDAVVQPGWMRELTRLAKD